MLSLPSYPTIQKPEQTTSRADNINIHFPDQIHTNQKITVVADMVV